MRYSRLRGGLRRCCRLVTFDILFHAETKPLQSSLLPSPSALVAELLSVYHATPAQIARHCGPDAAQFLPIGSPLFWAHFLLLILILALAHFGISRMEDQLRSDFSQKPGGTCSIVTILLQGIPKALSADKSLLEDYFQHRCSLDELTSKWIKIPNDISRLEARLSAKSLFGSSNAATTGENYLCRMVKYAWEFVKENFGFTEEERLRKLYISRLVLWSMLMEYREE